MKDPPPTLFRVRLGKSFRKDEILPRPLRKGLCKRDHQQQPTEDTTMSSKIDNITEAIARELEAISAIRRRTGDESPALLSRETALRSVLSALSARAGSHYQVNAVRSLKANHTRELLRKKDSN